MIFWKPSPMSWRRSTISSPSSGRTANIALTAGMTRSTVSPMAAHGNARDVVNAFQFASAPILKIRKFRCANGLLRSGLSRRTAGHCEHSNRARLERYAKDRMVHAPSFAPCRPYKATTPIHELERRMASKTVRRCAAIGTSVANSWPSGKRPSGRAIRLRHGGRER